MPEYFCPYCGKQTPHLNVKQAAATAQVTRTTIYNWIDKAIVHCMRRPSGRKFICISSLVIPDAFRGRPIPEALPVHSLELRRR